MKDNIYKKKQKTIKAFAFNEKIATVFSDMLNRSIPGYKTFNDLLANFNIFIQHNTNIYDLGCSLGASIFSITRNNNKKIKKIIAVDNSQEMLQKMKNNAQAKKLNIKYCHADIKDIKINNASIVMLNFVLQFIKTTDKNKILKNIYQGLKKDGVLIIAEKINYKNKMQQELLCKLHYEFKKNHGHYSATEIQQKEIALQQILYAETQKKLKKRLKKAGFKTSTTWFQGLNFIAIVAFG
ncbi:MAG: carboxy-S-adenosyl-L-methionine synthase CmoA [Gammaproteobacteria bacterium]|nr:MAG: carboxy-S-adenosyl-L-methionine synthase CmoA [Gammaproteobacteria bacterium]